MERRKHLRTPVSLRAAIHAGGRVFEAIAEDISPGGALMRCALNGEFPRVVATIGLPNGRDLHVWAVIRWRRNEPPGLGLQFERFLEAPESERILGRFLREGGIGQGGGSKS